MSKGQQIQTKLNRTAVSFWLDFHPVNQSQIANHNDAAVSMYVDSYDVAAYGVALVALL